MDIDELTDAFIAAYDEWCADEEHGMGGPTWDAMIDARENLKREQEKILIEKSA